jgi:hypothetical protein
MKQLSIIPNYFFKNLPIDLIGRLQPVKGICIFLLPVLAIFSLGSCQKENIQGFKNPGIQSTTSNSSDAAQSNNSSDGNQAKSVTFTMLMDFSTNPAFGTFTATGALNTSGSVEFQYNPNNNFITAHNVITLTSTDGTITIHDECEFAVDKAFPFGRGNWQIAGATGAYANIMGNGAESFPSSSEDILSGMIH